MSMPDVQQLREKQRQAEILDQAFTQARDDFYGQMFDPEFRELCATPEVGVDPDDDIDSPKYWAAFASFARQKAEAAREAGEDSGRLALYELYATTPDFIFKQERLDQMKPERSARTTWNHRKEIVYQQTLRTACQYNASIRTAVDKFPEIKSSELKTRLSAAAMKAIDSDVLARYDFTNYIASAIRGEQPDRVVGQLLSHTGRKYRHGNVQEDLQGIDWFVERKRPGQDPLQIDIKAAQGSRRDQDAMQYEHKIGYQIQPNGRIILYPHLLERHLGDRFYLHDNLAQEMAVELERILNEAGAMLDAQAIERAS